MKLSTELYLVNLVLLGVLFWCALRADVILWGLVLALMILVRQLANAARTRERCAEGLARARRMIDKKFKP